MKNVDKSKKEKILDLVLLELERELDTLSRAARDAHAGATHAESKQENKYDTRGLEASYLAHGQSRRALELESQIKKLRQFNLPALDTEKSICAGALVTVERDEQEQQYFLLPFAGGLQLNFQGKLIHILSLESPMGSELSGRSCGDDFLFRGRPHSIAEVE